MSCVFVVGISCKDIRKVEEPYKTLLYSFEVTWSDESKTVKELNIDSFHLFRKKLKTETYKARPEVTFPEVPDGKVSGFASKAKKNEKRRRQIEEFCTQLINLPHVQGKLQAIRNLFSETEDGQTQSSEAEAKDGGDKPNGSDADEKHGEADYVTVVPRGPVKASKAKKGVQLNYVQVEFLNPQVRVAKPTVKPVYAEVILSKQPEEWLFQVDGEGEEEDQNHQRIKATPSVSKQTPTTPPPLPPPIDPDDDDDEFAEKAKVLVPGEARELPDADETKPKPSSPSSVRISQRPPQPPETAIFDAAMLSNFPEGTLIPLPPGFSPEPCPVSADLKLTKNGHPPKDDLNHVYVVSICGWKAKGENSLTFKRGQRAVLLYTSATWWFISTGMSIGWVPRDHWRIVTYSKTISGKPLPALAPWNFGILDRKECEAMLAKGNQQDFLIRESSNSTGHLVLSVLHHGRVHHFEVQQQTEQGLFYIGSHNFKTIHNVVLYYMKKTLFVDENGNGVRLGRLFRHLKT